MLRLRLADACWQIMPPEPNRAHASHQVGEGRAGVSGQGVAGVP